MVRNNNTFHFTSFENTIQRSEHNENMTYQQKWYHSKSQIKKSIGYNTKRI